MYFHLINLKEFNHFKSELSKVKQFNLLDDSISAYKIYNDLICDKLNNGQNKFKQFTGNNYPGNLLQVNYPVKLNQYKLYLEQNEIKETLNVTFNSINLTTMTLQLSDPMLDVTEILTFCQSIDWWPSLAI